MAPIVWQQLSEEEKEEAIHFHRWAVYELMWAISRTDKPVASYSLDRPEADALKETAQEMAERLDIKMHLEVSDNEDADEAYAGATMYFYRHPIFLEALLYLRSDAGWNIPSDLQDCLEGLLFGYRTDAIQNHTERVRRSMADGTDPYP